MIRRVRGRLLRAEAGRVELMTATGVGYELRVPTTLLERLPSTGEEVELHAALVVKEAALELYGFASGRDRELFLRLQGASGVGPSLALAALGALPAGRLVRAIRAKEHGVLRTVSGVGKKTAERIALELADKLDDLVEEEEVPGSPSRSAAAVKALRSLGYGQRESEEAVATASASMDGAPAGTEELVRRALREL